MRAADASSGLSWTGSQEARADAPVDGPETTPGPCLGHGSEPSPPAQRFQLSKARRRAPGFNASSVPQPDGGHPHRVCGPSGRPSGVSARGASTWAAGVCACVRHPGEPEAALRPLLLQVAQLCCSFKGRTGSTVPPVGLPFIWSGLRGQAPHPMQFWGSATIFLGVFGDS